MYLDIINNTIANHHTAIVIFLLICVCGLMLAFVNIWVNLSEMKIRYRKMMYEADGTSLEKMLLSHSETLDEALRKIRNCQDDIQKIDRRLEKALTRIGIVRFAAFEDVGSDLSYAIALLDENNTGLIITSIFSRTDARSYVKPIENGSSKYKLIDEEVTALREAMQNGK